MRSTCLLGRVLLSLYKWASLLGMPDTAHKIGKCDLIFETVISWLQSVTLISGYRQTSI